MINNLANFLEIKLYYPFFRGEKHSPLYLTEEEFKEMCHWSKNTNLIFDDNGCKMDYYETHILKQNRGQCPSDGVESDWIGLRGL